MADVAVMRSPRRAHDLTLSVPPSSAGINAGITSGVSAAVSVSAVAISSRPPADVHIVPIVHIANQTAASDTSSVGAGTVRGPPPAAPPPPQRRSTDTQTETPAAAEPSREQRRRERRERRERAARRAPPPVPAAANASAQLPDLLNSHVPPHGPLPVPPPYSTLPHGATRGAPPPPPPPPPPPQPPPLPPTAGRCPYVAPPGSPQRSALCFGDGYNLAGVTGRRLPYRTEEEDPKSCCGLVVTQSVSIRWFIVMIAFVGLCCAIVGTVLGALKATGREHLTVSLLMIGVGIVLITVSGIAWRLTSRDSPSCRAMLGLARQQEETDSRRFMHRVVPAYGRPHHPYAAMVYPEFQFRPPPPSYHASMQAYRLGLLLDRHNAAAAGHGAALSPPPSYRPGTGTLRPGMNTLSRHSEYSHPPSYHSRQSSANPQPAPEPAVCHSRNPSVLSFLSHESLVFGAPLDGIASTDGVNVISVLQTGSLEDGKRKRRREKRESKEGRLEEEVKREDNLVTIVQTDGGHVTDDCPPPADAPLAGESHVTSGECHVTRSNSVVVTVSGSVERSAQTPGSDGEVEIVAHL